MKVLKYKRGQIWWYKMPNSFDGSIQGKTRPVIIVSNDLANAYSNCLLAIPCTTVEKKAMPTHTTFKVNNEIYNTALSENLTNINVNRLTSYMGMVDEELLTRLEYNMIVALGLEKYAHIPTPDNPVSIESQMSIVKTEIQPELNLEHKPVIKRGRRSTYTEKDKIRFINDYENYTPDYMIEKYNLKDKKALTNKVYMFRKAIGIHKNKRRV